MHVTLGEDGSWVVSITVFFFLINIGLARDLLPLLLLPTLLLKNLINGGGNFSVLPGLDMGLVDFFIFLLQIDQNSKKTHLFRKKKTRDSYTHCLEFRQ